MQVEGVDLGLQQLLQLPQEEEEEEMVLLLLLLLHPQEEEEMGGVALLLLQALDQTVVEWLCSMLQINMLHASFTICTTLQWAFSPIPSQ